MSNLTDFFPAPVAPSPWGPAGDPDYLVSLWLFGGGAGKSLIPNTTGGAGGGWFFSNNQTAIYAGVPVPVTVGSGGASATPAGSPGTPSGLASPGSPSTFGCITAYGGGAPGTGGISGQPGGVGGTYIGFPTFINCNCPVKATQLERSGSSYNFTTKFGIHRGYWCQAGSVQTDQLVSFGLRFLVNDGTDPRYPIPSYTCVPGFYCLDVSLGTCYNSGTTFGSVGHTRCYYDSPYSSCVISCAAGTATGASCNVPSSSGIVWVVYPCAYPAATAPGAVNCTPCVKTGFRAYKYTSPGSFTLS